MRKAKPRKRDPKTGYLPPLTDPAVMLAEAAFDRVAHDRRLLERLERQYPEIAAELDRRDRAARRSRKRRTRRK